MTEVRPGVERAVSSDAPAPEPTEASQDVELTVELRGVFRAFGDVVALADLDLLVPRGRITVLLGPNGAGKTTAIRVITGALEPDRGIVRAFGLDPHRAGAEVRRRCGIVSAKPALYDRLSGRDNLDYAGRLYGLGANNEARITAAAERFGIQHALDQQVGGYSTGMKTRLALARSIMHEPDLLLFDEPTSGLDPESSAAVLELIRQMTDEGRTVVMCTHLLVEAEGLADSVVMLEGGTDLLTGPPDELARRFWPGFQLRVDTEDRSHLELLADCEGVLTYERNGFAQVQLDEPARIPDLVEELIRHGARITRVEPHIPSLEDLYFEVRRQRRAEGTGSSS